jgi:hypothetical protein
VLATGRARRESPWLGLKFHVHGLTLTRDLELHLGNEGYVGLATTESGAVAPSTPRAPRSSRPTSTPSASPRSPPGSAQPSPIPTLVAPLPLWTTPRPPLNPAPSD